MVEKTIGNAAELKKLLNRQLENEGWESLRQFTSGSKIPLSAETIRRAFMAQDYKNMEPMSLAIICRYLNFTPDEIRDMLKTYTNDNVLWPMIGKGDGVRLSVYDQALLGAAKTIAGDDKERMTMLADQFDLMARAVGVDVSEYTRQIRRRRGSISATP